MKSAGDICLVSQSMKVLSAVHMLPFCRALSDLAAHLVSLVIMEVEKTTSIHLYPGEMSARDT
jgi:hypothetical protein